MTATRLRLRICAGVGRRSSSGCRLVSRRDPGLDQRRGRRARGAEKLEQGPRDYFAGGAGDELTLRENVAAWGHWRLRPRVLNDVREVSTAAEVLGEPVAMPVLVAPVAYQRMAHPEAERGMAAGAAAAGTAMCLSTLSTTRPAEVAAAAPQGRHWFQLYAFKDAGVTRALMDEAIDAGFEAILVTADAPPGGNRERDRRNGFTLPQELGTPEPDRRHRRRARR